MRIVEVRRFLGYFVVFVNDAQDIKILEKDKRFTLHSFYKDVKHNFYGKEYRFQCSSSHTKSAKKFIKAILKEAT